MRTAETSTQFLFLCRQPPFGRSGFGAGLDMLLTAATFDQSVCLLFCGEGVMQLLSLDGEVLGLKDPARALEALSVYGVDKVLVEAESLEAQALSTDDLAVEVESVDAGQIQDLIEAAGEVVIL